MNALRMFFARHSSYRKNDLFLTGHGYASVYVTYMARAIIEENLDPQEVYNDRFKLKGILMGNPCTKPDECHSAGSGKSSYYHYQFLYNRGFFTTKTWNEFLGLCALNYEDVDCYTKRNEMDKIFNTTNTSMYNIYDKCYRSQNSSENYINTGCEDNAGILTFLNEPSTKKKWNIYTEKEWTPCSSDVFK